MITNVDKREWRSLQDPDSVGRSRSLPPSSDADDYVTGFDKAVLLAEIDTVLDALVNILGPVGKSLVCNI